MGCRFVQPEVTRIPLSEGDWIDVKKRLTVGEERAAFQQIVGEVNAQGWRRPNMEMMGIAEMAAYIVGWSFVDARGLTVGVSISSIQALDSASFKELETALEAHIKAMEAEIEAAKNGRARESAPEPTLPSAGSSIGPGTT